MISAFLRGLDIVPQLASKQQMPFSAERPQLSALASLALRREWKQLQRRSSFKFATWRRSEGLATWRMLLGSSSLCLLVRMRMKGAGGNLEEGLVQHGRGVGISRSDAGLTAQVSPCVA